MKNKLTQLLGIQYPIIQGGLAWSSDAVLAAAVSNAGGIGQIGSGGRTTDWTRDEIRKAKSLTDKPFGVNIMLMAPNIDELIDLVCEEKVVMVTLGAGNPVPYFDKLHSAGIKVVPVVPSVKLAKRVEEKGADALVVEGMEAGGHIGTLTTMALMSNVIPLIKIPVVVAGGISDGKAMAAAMLMGAAGVQMGSRFVMTEECPAHINCKNKIAAATDTDSVVTGYSRGHGVRGLKNTFTTSFLIKETSGVSDEELAKFSAGTNKLASVDGDIENGVVQIGQSLEVLKEVKTCKQAIDDIIVEARETLANAAKIQL